MGFQEHEHSRCASHSAWRSGWPPGEPLEPGLGSGAASPSLEAGEPGWEHGRGSSQSPSFLHALYSFLTFSLGRMGVSSPQESPHSLLSEAWTRCSLGSLDSWPGTTHMLNKTKQKKQRPGPGGSRGLGGA